MKLSNSDVEYLMAQQEQLNSKFSVNRWDDDLVETALICEYAEFMNEIQTQWKNWKKVEDNIPNAKIEFIDCVHFMLSLLLIRMENDPVGAWVTVELNTPPHRDFLRRINRNFLEFVDARETFPLSKTLFIRFVETVTEFLGMDESEFFRYFETKKRINEERAAGGYSTGEYANKETEQQRF